MIPDNIDRDETLTCWMAMAPQIKAKLKLKFEIKMAMALFLEDMTEIGNGAIPNQN